MPTPDPYYKGLGVFYALKILINQNADNSTGSLQVTQIPKRKHRLKNQF